MIEKKARPVNNHIAIKEIEKTIAKMEYSH
jgi:hypothetical protein